MTSPPRPSPEAQPPVLWGNEDHARQLLEAQGLEVEFDRGEVAFRAESIPGYMDMMEANFGPLVTAREVLGEDGWAPVRAEIIELEERLNRADDGSMDVAGQYLTVVARKP